MRMKINLPVRLKNPWFWVGLVGVILTAMGVNLEMLTSWQAVADSFKDLVSNPYMIGSVTLAVLGVFVDPTTKSLGDSDRAMAYQQPKE